MAVQILPKNLFVITWNANSVIHKKAELGDFLHENNVDVALVQETFLRPQHKLKIANYTTHRQDRTDRQGGGTAILIKKHIKHHAMTIPNFDNIETTKIQVTMADGPLTFVSAYRPPNRAFTVNDLDNLFNQVGPMFVGGDLNAKNTLWGCRVSNAQGRILSNHINRNLITVHAPNEPTHFSSHHTSDTLDMAFTKNFHYNVQTSVISDLSSDHSPVSFTIGHTHEDNKIKHTTRTNWKKFQEVLAQNITQTPDIHDKRSLNFTTITLSQDIRNALEEAKYTTTHTQNNPYSLPPDIRQLIRERNRLKRRAKNTQNPLLNTQANRLTTRIRAMIRELSNQKWEDHLNSLNPEDNSLWRTVRCLKNSSQPIIPPIHGPFGMAYSDERKADAFASSLESQFRPNRDRGDDIDHEELVEEAAEEILHLPIENLPPIPPTTVGEVMEEIKFSNPKKAPGLDDISNTALKKFPLMVVEKFVLIINFMFAFGFYPSVWKKAKIIMIPKAGQNLTFPQNWRPISLISSMAKIAEKIFLKRLNDIIFEQHLIPDEQFGFRPEHSTTLQLVRLAETITRGFHRGQVTGLIALDIQKAFDKVWHEGLVYKLHHVLKIPLPFVKLIQAFITRRKFVVRINQELSSFREIEAGVPQGSPLSPILYNLYTSDIPKSRGTRLALYADDTGILATGKNPTRVRAALQLHLNAINTWLQKWKIKINPNKTQATIFSRQRSRRPPEPIVLEGTRIPWGDTLKYLGVLLDKKLTWGPHLTSTIQKCNQAFGALYPLIGKKSKLNIKNKLLLLKQVIRPKALYGCVAWCQAAKSHRRKVQTLQNKILRAIVNAPWYVRNVDLHEDLRVETTYQAVKKQQETLFANIANHSNPLIRRLFNHPPNLRRKRHKNLHTPITL